MYSSMKTRLIKKCVAPVADAIILDGAALVQMLNPGTSRIFQQYRERLFAPYISALLEKKQPHRLCLGFVLTYQSESVNQTEERERYQMVAASIVKPNN